MALYDTTTNAVKLKNPYITLKHSHRYRPPVSLSN